MLTKSRQIKKEKYILYASMNKKFEKMRQSRKQIGYYLRISGGGGKREVERILRT